MAGRHLLYSLCHLLSHLLHSPFFMPQVQLIRIQLRVPENWWTIQKVFHLMNFIVNGLRAILFGLYKNVFVLSPKVLEIVLLDLPGLLFFSTYTLLVLFWAEIYHQARSLPINKLKSAYLIINGVVYFIQVCIWIYMSISGKPVAVEVAKFYFSVISFVAALGFLIYGGRLFFMLRCFPIESRGRQTKLNEVGFVTGICCTCFLIRCFVVALSAVNDGAKLDVLNHPLLSFIYYMIAEIIPSSLVLFILRKVPPRRVSTQYHPIQ
ncbi:tobamovirus multiplication protein 1-like isoform X2 [Telopea speciosissima]|uniref:tobamovirus multiplication protein 1-like isoform X2 n=1 Tax=Telopea speciosissima TaxID=54955 RepID=UPI001CC7F7F3|nr:tobamovirus multiplication protein 1-like isoform X2 [Telopea speciosissima]